MAAGASVFEQGDVGDRYYVVESGQVDVVGDGRLLATLGAGEGFGEIALLRRSARTASVAARTDVRLRSLDADCFLTVVLGYTPSAREAALGVGRLLERYDPEPGEPGQPGQTPTRPVHPDGDQQEVRER